MADQSSLEGLIAIQGLLLSEEAAEGTGGAGSEPNTLESRTVQGANADSPSLALHQRIQGDGTSAGVTGTGVGPAAGAVLLPVSFPASSPSSTLAFFLQLAPPPQGLVAAVLPQLSPAGGSAVERLKLPPGTAAATASGATSVGGAAVGPLPPPDFRDLRRCLLMLSFNSPAATLAALSRLQSAAAATQGRAVLAALQPVPLVARAFADAAAAGDATGAERAAAVLLALLGQAGLALPDDAAATAVLPAAVRLLAGGASVGAAAAGAAVAAAAMTAIASGTVSSTLQLYMTAATSGTGSAAGAHNPYNHQHHQQQQWYPYQHRPPAKQPMPLSCRLAAARLLLFLATAAPVGAPAAAPAAALPGPRGPGPGASRDRLVSAGSLEACALALRDSLAGAGPGAAELQLVALRLLAALTADVAGEPWEWPVVRAAAVEGCARGAVALMQLLAPMEGEEGEDGEGEAAEQQSRGAGSGGDGAGADYGPSGRPDLGAYLAACAVVCQLARGPLLVREVLVRAGVLSPVVEAVMLWPPPPAGGQGGAGAAASAGSELAALLGFGSPSRCHFVRCLGVLLALSALPGVRAALGSSGLGPLLGHLLALMEQQGDTTSEGSGREGPWPGLRGSSGNGAGQQEGAPARLPASGAESATASGTAAAGAVRGTLLELLLNLALDAQRCHGGLVAAGAPAMLIRCIGGGSSTAAGRPSSTAVQTVPAQAEQLQLGPTQDGGPRRPQQQLPWRAAAALRLVAALAADPRFTAPRPAMQTALAAAGAVEAVAEAVQRAAAALPASGGGGAVLGGAYELSVSALCALMTANGSMQRRVARVPGLLAALSAAVAHPAVRGSDARVRVTLAAWRLITAPLAGLGGAAIDPIVAHYLLVGLGHAPPSGAAADPFDAVLALAPSASLARPQPRPSQPGLVIVGSVPVGGGGGGGGGLQQQHHPVYLSSPSGSMRRSSLDRDRQTRRSSDFGQELEQQQRSQPPPRRSIERERSTPTIRQQLPRAPSDRPGAISPAGATLPPAPVWTGPLLPGTPIGPPGAPPPDISPLRLPSCVVAAATPLLPSLMSRRGSGGRRPVSGATRGPVAGNAASTTAAGSSKDGSQANVDDDGVVAVSASSVSASSVLEPHRSVFSSPDSDEGDSGNVGPGTPSSRALSRPISALAPSGRSTQRKAGAAAAAVSAPPPSSGSSMSSPRPLTLPGALEEAGPPMLGGDSSAARRAESQTGQLQQESSLPGTRRGPRPPSATGIGLPGDEPEDSGGSAVLPLPPSGVLQDQLDGESDTPAAATAAALVAAAGGIPGSPPRLPAVAIIPATEMAPPLLCLVTHLQALLPRPSCRAGAALVLVQLARLEVVGRSGVLAAGWAPLMEAITSSLAGAAEREGGPPGMARPRAGRGVAAPAPMSRTAAAAVAAAARRSEADPRDQLALLEAMEVAASAGERQVEGRAPLTSAPVVTALAELVCGEGVLAASLAALSSEGVLGLQGSLSLGSHHFHQGRHQRRGQGPEGWHSAQHHAQQQYAAEQSRSPLLLRARALAMSILAELVPLPHVADQVQGGYAGGLLAAEVLPAMVAAAAAAEPHPSVLTGMSGGGGGALARSMSVSGAAAGVADAPGDEQARRMRNAAARLLRRLAEHVPSALVVLRSPHSVGLLVATLSSVWDLHAHSLGPAAVAPTLLPRPSAPSAAVSNFVLASHRPPPLLLEASASGAGASYRHAPTASSPGTGRPLLPSPAGPAAAAAAYAVGGSFMHRSFTTGGIVATPRPTQPPLLQSGLSHVARAGGNPHLAAALQLAAPPDSPHGVATRMSAHTAAGPDAMQWNAPPPQRAMRALERATEEQEAHEHDQGDGGGLPHHFPPAAGLPHSSSGARFPSVNGSGSGAAAPTDTFRNPSLSSRDPSGRLTPNDVSGPPQQLLLPPQGAANGVVPSILSRQGTPLRQVATAAVLLPGGSTLVTFAPGAIQQTLASQPAGGGVDGGGAAAAGSAAAGPQGSVVVDVLFGDESSDSDLEGHMAGERRSSTGGGGEGAGGAVDRPIATQRSRKPVARRGTRALAPPMPAAGPGPLSSSGAGTLSGPSPRAAATAAAAQCCGELVELLTVLAAVDPDAARAMATLPAVELFVDLLGCSVPGLAQAALGLLGALAARQDAHESLWDCDAVAGLVAHLLLRSPATQVAAAAAAANAAPTARTTLENRVSGGGGGASDSGVSPRTSRAGAGPDPPPGAAAAPVAGPVPASRLQLSAAQVVGLLCADPDLHGRLAATELPTALMALVRRGAEPEATQAPNGGWLHASASLHQLPAGPASPSLLVAALSALSSLMECADVRKQARERHLPLYLGKLASTGGGSKQGSKDGRAGGGGGSGGGDPVVADLAAHVGEWLRADMGPPSGRLHPSQSNPL